MELRSVAVIVIVVALFSAFCSGMELAFTHSNKLQLEVERKRGGFRGRILHFLLRSPERFLTTLLVGNNVALVIYSTYMTLLIHGIAELCGWTVPQEGGVVIETLISTLFIILIGEYTPKTLVSRNPNFYLRLLAVPMAVCYVLLYPFAVVVSWMSTGLLRLFGLGITGDARITRFGRVDLEDLAERTADGAADNGIRIFQNALEFPDLKVRDCMVPRVDIEAVEYGVSVDRLSARFVETAFSRLFVWKGSIDDIVGYVNSKSLFRNPRSMGEIVMPVTYVPETMSVEKLLGRFIKQHLSVAVVIDEFGGTAGIISLEDMLEELFGDIQDEHDSEDADKVEVRISDGEWIFSCRLEIDYLNEKYGLGIRKSDDYDTLAGLIISETGDIPEKGDVLEIQGLKIEIMQSSSSRVQTAKVSVI